MSDVVRLAIVDPSDASRNSLKTLLLGIETVWLEAECSRYEFFSEVVEQTQPDIALISLDAAPQQALDLVATIAHTHPNCHALVVSSSQEGSLILRAMRNGALPRAATYARANCDCSRRPSLRLNKTNRASSSADVASRSRPT